jgi:hypothetical protein
VASAAVDFDSGGISGAISGAISDAISGGISSGDSSGDVFVVNGTSSADGILACGFVGDISAAIFLNDFSVVNSGSSLTNSNANRARGLISVQAGGAEDLTAS